VTVPVSISPSSAQGTVTGTVGQLRVTAPITSGTAQLTLPAGSLAPGSHKLTVTYTGEGGYSSSRTSASVKVVKGTPVVTVKTAASIKRGRTATFTVTVKAAGVTPSGWITVKVAGRSVKAKLNANRSATLRVTKIKKVGKQAVIATYGGSTYLASATGKAWLTVKR